MTTSTTPRGLHLALPLAALTVLSLGLAGCTDGTGPEEQEMDLAALQAALDEAHESHDDQGADTLDDIETAAYAQIDAALADGDIDQEDARLLRAWVAERKEANLESVRAGRLTMQEACAHFREDIVNLAIRLEDHANNS